MQHDALPPFLLIFDLDGVLYRGETALPDAAGTVDALRAAGFQIAFMTNNAWSRAEEFAAKLTRLGIRAEPQEVMTSAIGTAQLIREECGPCRVLAIGGPGLRSYLAEAGLVVITPDEPEVAVDAVAVGIDWEFSYSKLARAQQALLNGARFYATNIDPRYPIENGRFNPGAGSIVAAISTASGVTPIIVGKPASTCFELMMEERACPPKKTLIVGDQLATDIIAGNRAGCRTALITTGVSTREEAEILRGTGRPTFIYDSLTELASALIQDELLVVRP